MKREFLQSLQVGQEALSKEVIDAIMAENGKDIQNAKDQAKLWQDRYNEAVAEHTQKLAQMEFSARLDRAITQAKGRNAKAITALLDVAALQQSQDQEREIMQAVEQLKEENGYLFDSQETPPPYAVGTGGNTLRTGMGVQSLAGALKERYAHSRQ